MHRILAMVAMLSWATCSNAEMMTVRQLKEILAKGEIGEWAATSYVNGVVDGMMGMDSLFHRERKTPIEFCRLQLTTQKTGPVKHPAYRTKEMIKAWEAQGRPMETMAVDMILMFLTAQYGCKR